ncbi:hypothetical protein J1614_006439 [Plenodomus biglobosus]|nr:hypothetical protein J1614_006439 [Plenodomus biglobosus]
MRSETSLPILLSILATSASAWCTGASTTKPRFFAMRSCPTTTPPGLDATRAYCDAAGYVDFGLGMGQRTVNAYNGNTEEDMVMGFEYRLDTGAPAYYEMYIGATHSCKSSFPRNAKLVKVTYQLLGYKKAG